MCRPGRGIVLTAGYILWLIQRVLFGPVLPRYENVDDATLLEAVPLVVLVIAIVVVGIYPALLIDVFNSSIAPMVATRFG